MERKNIHIGFNLNNTWLAGQPFVDVVLPLINVGLSVLELHLDLRFPEIADHIDMLCESGAQHGLGICFHAPYLDPPLMYGFAREKREPLIAQWKPMLDLVNRYSNTNDIRTEMVLHGSHGPFANYKHLFDDTVSIAQWILDYCPDLWLGIENLPTPRAPSEMVKYGEDRASVLNAVVAVNHPRCGITWDMGHCTRNHVFNLPSTQWVSKVIHAHVHDVDKERQDHWPLIFGRTPYREWIKYLINNGFAGTITAELNGALYSDWPQEKIDNHLLETIKKINSAIQSSNSGL